MPIYSQYDVPNSNDMVNLGVGQPSTKDLPLNWFKDSLMNISSKLDNPEFLQYGAISGYDSVKETLAKWLSKKYKNNVTKDQLFMTNGNTGGLQLLMDIFMESGDEIIIEDPTYFIAKNIFDEYGLNINPVPMTENGIDIVKLEEAINKIIDNDEKNLQSKIFLYTIPIHHNPSSITLSKENRIKLAKLCKKYPKFYVIADEVYHFLSYDNLVEYPPLADYHEKIFSLGSFSKLVSPSLRVGWIYQNNLLNKENPYDLIDRLKKSSILDSSGGINPLGYLIIENAINDKTIDKLIENNIKTLSEKSQIMYEFITSHLKDIKVIKPKGGYFLWLNLNSIDGNDFLNFATICKVKFHPGFKFGETCDNYIRLSVSYYDQDDLILGLSRLMEAYTLFKSIRVSIFGSTGRLGSLIKNEITNNTHFTFIEGITRDIKINEKANVIVDVSSNDGTKSLLTYLIKNSINKALIIGTTGLTPDTQMLIKRYSIKNPVCLVSNFSEGISKIKKIISELNSLGQNWKFNMLEKHHQKKIDKPSGTAKTLAKEIKQECPIESVREGDIIGYHQILINSKEEEIIISHNAKDRNIFAKGCLNYIKWIVLQKPGLYYEIENIKEYEIDTILGTKMLITEKHDVINNNNDDISFKILFTKENNLYKWKIVDKINEPFNTDSNHCLMIVKYLHKTYNISTGKLRENSAAFKIKDRKIYLEVPDPKLFDLNNTESQNLGSLIRQLSGLNMVGVSKYLINNEYYLIIEIANVIDEIDSDVFSTLGTIVNSEKTVLNSYHILFINILTDNQIRIRFFNKYVGKEIDGDADACLAVSDYFTYVNDLSYDDNIETSIILNNDIVKILYNSGKYYIVYSM